MIDAREVSEAIAEIEASRNQSPGDCLRLASLYTIRDHLESPQNRGKIALETLSRPEVYSYIPVSQGAGNDAIRPEIQVPSELVEESEFLQAVDGKPAGDVWRILDDLLDTLRVTGPRAYASVLRRLNQI